MVEPADEAGYLGAPVAGDLDDTVGELRPLFVGDTSETPDGVLVLVRHEISIAGWLTTRPVVCNTEVVNHPLPVRTNS